MGTVVTIYVLLLIVFVVISGLIFRHTLKFSYLSPRFKYIVAIFALISAILIILSVYLLFQADSGSSIPNNTTNSSSELNF